MKLHQDQPESLNTITAYDAGMIEINARQHHGSLYFMPSGEIRDWPVQSPESLTADDLNLLLSGKPEIVLLGTGSKQKFFRPEVLAPLVSAGIGHEIMSTPAACRTYNILMAEGRQVMAALLPTG